MSPSEERIELAPGVYSRLPEDRVLKQWDLLAGDHLISQEYAEASTWDELPDGANIISYLGATLEGQEPCDPREEIIESDPVPSSGGYDRVVRASGSMDRGEITVAGRDAIWELYYLSFATTWDDPVSGDVSRYPNYSASVFLDVCIEDLDLTVTYGSNSATLLSEEDSGNPPVETRNAFLSDAREEVHSEIAEQYSSDIEDVVQFVEDISTDERDGETDLSTLPRSFEDHNEILPDPFQGELAESDNGSYTTPETTSDEDLVGRLT
jgi:hypothetical protein